MTFGTIVFLIGSIMVAFGLVGEGFTIKDISIPKAGKVSRVSLMVLGSIFITLGLSFGAAEIATEISENSQPETDAEPTLDTDPLSVPEAETYLPLPEPLPEPSIDLEADPWLAEVEQALIEMSESILGYTLIDYYISNLQNSESESITITLEAGVPYIITGVCDSDCDDMDLWLYDENGDLVDFDEELDAYPFVEVTPEATVEFVLEAFIPDCSADICYYGVGLSQSQSDQAEVPLL